MGPPAPAELVGGLRRPGLPHRAAAPHRPGLGVVALSTGGVYRTTDDGASWEPRNAGIRAEFLPEGEQYPEFGQCVHKVARHPSRPERLYAQNHGGVYRSDDEGGSWTSIADGLPADFGFPVVVHPHEPDTVYVFPLGGAGGRYPPDGRARVWCSRDAGASWTELGEGLPDGFFVGVLRDAMSSGRPRLDRASTSAAATAPSGPPPTRGRPGAAS